MRAAVPFAILFTAMVFSTNSLEAQSSNEPALPDAAARGDIAAVRALTAERAQNKVETKIEIDARDAQGRTALLIATHRNDVEMARVLIDAGADVNAKDAIQDSPYLYAAAEGRLDILRMTLAAGADLKSVNRYGGTGLIPAAHHGHVDTVRELLRTGIAVDHVNRLGWTALLEAIILGDGGAAHTEIVHLLIAAKADVNLADSQGVSPLAHAERRGYRDMAMILRAAGAR